MLIFCFASNAFAPGPALLPAAAAPMPRMNFIDTLEGAGEETGGQVWDPLDIASSVSDEAVMWFRASELKHGRVSMLATVGYMTGAAGITFPGELAKGLTFAEAGADGVGKAWANVPEEGKLQILFIILCLETATESKKPHYMRGGVPGKIDSLPYDGIKGVRPFSPNPQRGPNFAPPPPRDHTDLGAQDQVLGPSELHGRTHCRAEG